MQLFLHQLFNKQGALFLVLGQFKKDCHQDEVFFRMQFKTMSVLRAASGNLFFKEALNCRPPISFLFLFISLHLAHYTLHLQIIFTTSLNLCAATLPLMYYFIFTLICIIQQDQPLIKLNMYILQKISTVLNTVPSC